MIFWDHKLRKTHDVNRKALKTWTKISSVNIPRRVILLKLQYFMAIMEIYAARPKAKWILDL